ncbi:hypothetical protein [Dyella japonica]|uniref:Uncharacterized protein n=1 Tax=Dyella japonica TaxID=231455 RepID=A0ABV2JYY3_9GAMM
MSLLSITRTRPKSFEGCTPLDNDQRRAEWAAKFYGGGHHHRQRKQRIRVKPRIRIVND